MWWNLFSAFAQLLSAVLGGILFIFYRDIEWATLFFVFAIGLNVQDIERILRSK